MFRFTIRDVLWLTVVVAMGVGWRLDHRRIRVIESQRDTWRASAIKARDNYNGQKSGGKWVSATRIEFDDNGKTYYSFRRDGAPYAVEQGSLQWRQDWADVRD